MRIVLFILANVMFYLLINSFVENKASLYQSLLYVGRKPVVMSSREIDEHNQKQSNKVYYNNTRGVSVTLSINKIIKEGAAK
ncbi:MAG: hypothetical protein D6735_06670 [Acidobacteria bacterium]|nr:MAG: hypothetical protein D6735_06670 [Acidobacteriota bacterium]